MDRSKRNELRKLRRLAEQRLPPVTFPCQCQSPSIIVSSVKGRFACRLCGGEVPRDRVAKEDFELGAIPWPPGEAARKLAEKKALDGLALLA